MPLCSCSYATYAVIDLEAWQPKCSIVIIFSVISSCYSTIKVPKCRCYVNESIGMAVRHADSIRERSQEDNSDQTMLNLMKYIPSEFPTSSHMNMIKPSCPVSLDQLCYFVDYETLNPVVFDQWNTCCKYSGGIYRILKTCFFCVWWLFFVCMMDVFFFFLKFCSAVIYEYKNLISLKKFID